MSLKRKISDKLDLKNTPKKRKVDAPHNSNSSKHGVESRNKHTLTVKRSVSQHPNISGQKRPNPDYKRNDDKRFKNTSGGKVSQSVSRPLLNVQNSKNATRPTQTTTVITKVPVSKKLVDPDVHRLKVDAPGLLRVTNTLFLREFDLQTLLGKDGKRLGIVGMSGSGKSRLMIYILRLIKDGLPAGTVFNASESGNFMYTPHIHPACIHETMDFDALERFKKRQIDRCNKWRVPGSDPAVYTRDPTAFLILDDMFEDTKAFNDKIFGWIFLNSRNFKTFFVILVQYYVLLPVKYRRNLSHLFLFRQNSIREIKKIWLEFFGVFERELDFRHCLEVCTAGNGCIVIDILNPSTRKEDRIFYLKFSFKQPPFTVGDPDFNKQLDELYDKDWQKRDEDETRKREREETEEAEELKSSKKRKKTTTKKEVPKKNEPLKIELI